ncbi:DUF3012 domain-containing protein [Marinimicrobium sp. ARAG 43.8]|uniref:DUF3012 domain-containing protein n=1 Tax=Marinimicrobium sp. ARAG 43.8 TaxID=3418719 RepID=UPI003CE7379B
MKTIYALMVISVLMIALGVFLIMSQPSEPPQPKRDIGLIPALPESANEIPKLEERAEPGSEAWCEQMMNVPNNDWTEDDSRTFAKHCIYD